MGPIKSAIISEAYVIEPLKLVALPHEILRPKLNGKAYFYYKFRIFFRKKAVIPLIAFTTFFKKKKPIDVLVCNITLSNVCLIVCFKKVRTLYYFLVF